MMEMKMKVKMKALLWAMKQRLTRSKRVQVWGGALICLLFLTFATPKIPYSPTHHVYADMRNFLGVPNTLNVLTNFPFLIVGVVGLLFCLQGSFFKIGLTEEIVVWALFYAGIAGVAFGSAYYHLRPDDDKVIWDTLPVLPAFLDITIRDLEIIFLNSNDGSICVRSFLAFLWREWGNGWDCASCGCFSLFRFLALHTRGCRTFNDLRLRMMFQLIPCIVIPFMTLLFPPNYTHSRYWLWAAGIYLLSKFEAVADRKIYIANNYIISGHSLEHLCLAMFPTLLAFMLLYRSLKFQTLGDLKENH